MVNIGYSSDEAKGTFFLSCAHGLPDGNSTYMRMDGRRIPVRLLAKKRTNSIDLAIFFLPNVEMKPCYEILKSSPQLNEPAWIVGYPIFKFGSYRKLSGKISSTSITGFEYAFSKVADSGDSGGPLFTGDHKVSGIVIESSKEVGDTLVTTVPDIREFLISSIGGVPNCSKPKTKKPSINTAPSIKSLLEKITLLEKRIIELESRQPQKGDRGERGVPGQTGLQGSQGVPGKQRTVIVILQDSTGNQLLEPIRLPPGKSTVRIPIERFTRKNK